MLNKAILYFCFIVLFICCKKESGGDEEQIPQRKEIEVLEPQFLTDGGVRIAIRVNSVPSGNNNDLSLAVSRDSSLRSIIQFHRIENPIQAKTYEMEIRSGLDIDSTYYYGYFLNGKVATGDDDIFKFTFVKEGALVIDSISRLEASVGDTLKLYGDFKGFQITGGGVGEVTLNTYRQSDNIVHIILDEKTPTGQHHVFLNSTYQRTNYHTVFQLLKPSITRVPEEVMIDQEVSIEGENFSPYRDGNKVYLNDKEVSVKSYSKNQLSFIIPTNISSATLYLKIMANNDTVTSDVPMRIRKPEVTDVPGDITIGRTYTLVFDHLPKTSVKVFLGGFEVSILHRYEQQGKHYLLAHPLVQPYSSKNVKLELEYLDEKLPLGEDIKILDRWWVASNKIPFDVVGIASPAVVVNNTAYTLGLPSVNAWEGKVSLWKFNKSSATFSEILIPMVMRSPHIVAHKGKIYIYTGDTGDNFYEFDPASNRFKNLPNYPSAERLNGTINVLNGKIYLVTGHNPGATPYLNSEGDITMYVYDISSRTWSRSVDFPEGGGFAYNGRLGAASFVVQNQLYVMGGPHHTGQVETYSFDPVTDRWSTHADIFDFGRRSAVSIGNYGYFFCNDLMRYDPNRDVWEKLEHIIPYGKETHHTMAFVIDNELYFNIDRSDMLFKVPVADLIR